MVVLENFYLVIYFKDILKIYIKREENNDSDGFKIINYFLVVLVFVVIGMLFSELI